MPVSAVCRMVRGASERHLRLGVTGELTYADGVFHKVIEGPCEAILLLASEILADERYESIEVTRFEQIEARRHSEWRVTGVEETAEIRLLWDRRTAQLPPVPEVDPVAIALDGHA